MYSTYRLQYTEYAPTAYAAAEDTNAQCSNRQCKICSPGNRFTTQNITSIRWFVEIPLDGTAVGSEDEFEEMKTEIRRVRTMILGVVIALSRVQYNNTTVYRTSASISRRGHKGYMTWAGIRLKYWAEYATTVHATITGTNRSTECSNRQCKK